MGQMHTFADNVLNLGVGQGIDADGGNSGAVDTDQGRANAILVTFTAATISAANTVTLSLEDSDDGLAWAPVVNDDNNGLAVPNSMFGLNLAQERVEGPSLLIDDGTNGHVVDFASGEIVTCEYLGAKKFFRVVGAVAASGAGTFNAMGGQSALRVEPNLGGIGDNS